MRGLAIVVLMATLVGCAAAPSTAPPTPTAPTTYAVDYRVTSPKSGTIVTLRYTNQGNDVESREHVTLPWSLHLTAQRGWSMAVTAQDEGEHGDVIAEILVDGQVWRHTESKGLFAKASCHGVMGQAPVTE